MYVFFYYKSLSRSLSWSRCRCRSQSRSWTKPGPGPGPIIFLVPALVLVPVPACFWSRPWSRSRSKLLVPSHSDGHLGSPSHSSEKIFHIWVFRIPNFSSELICLFPVCFQFPVCANLWEQADVRWKTALFWPSLKLKWDWRSDSLSSCLQVWKGFLVSRPEFRRQFKLLSIPSSFRPKLGKFTLSCN